MDSDCEKGRDVDCARFLMEEDRIYRAAASWCVIKVGRSYKSILKLCICD